MTLRTRVALLAAGSVAVAVVVAAAGSYVAARAQMRNQIDESLRDAAPPRPGPRQRVGRIPRPARAPGGLDLIVQFVDAQGRTVQGPDEVFSLPVDDVDLAVARGEQGAVARDAEVEGVHVRLLTEPRGFGAVQVGRALTEVDEALRGLLVLLAFVAGGGVVAAAGLGFAVARSALAPVGELTRAAERVAATQELDARIPDRRGDELGRLAAAFNEMLSALEASRTQQRRLVADASHELRTPLTSLRTNIELLAKAPRLPGAEREKLLADVTAELAELGHLVAELVDLAGDPNATQEAATDVRLDELAGQVVERARRRTGTDITLDAEAVVVRGRPAALERAIANLVDNACKWSPAAEVWIRGGMVEVRDRGPGIEPGDRPRVFDRFFRASTARSMPGSGLGLAIVKQAVEAHGGRVWVEENPGGGAVVGFEIPGAERVGG